MENGQELRPLYHVEAPTSWCWISPVSATAAIWGVRQYMEDPFLYHYLHFLKYKIKLKKFKTCKSKMALSEELKYMQYFVIPNFHTILKTPHMYTFKIKIGL